MKHNIIYIDDEPENLRAFKAAFRKDYNIYTTSSPKEGIDYLHRNKVDLIITDQRMPEMTGTEFLEKVFDFLPEIPPSRIIYSGYSESKDIEIAKEKQWMSTFISKPCDLKEFKAKIDQAIIQC